MNSQNPSISSMLSTFPRRSVGALDYKHPDYVKRDTDKELLDALKKGDFCFVLNSPQTGKSSLMVQILNDLKEEGFLCISIDLTGFVEKINYTSDQFYRDFSQQLLDNLKENIILSNFKLDDWWLTKTDLSPLYRLRSFITDIILQETSPQKLVIFVDEINCTLNFESRSDFFKLIRFFYNRRPMTADYNRLTFALLGIATPSQLCPDERISPFNVGKNIKLRPFQPHEITRWKERLVKEINYSEAKAKEAMERILSFTNGHPYLTHSLYNLVIKESANANTDVNTDQLVEEKIIRGWRNSDCEDHFQIIIQSLSQPNKRSMDLLSLYEKIVRSTLNDCPITAVQANSSDMLQIDLKLLGLVLEEDHVLKPYCKIYEQIFNLSWIEVQQREVIFYKEDYDNYCNTDKYQKQRYLLTGKILKRTLKWASENENTVKHLEKNFFEESEKFWKKAQKFFPDQTEDECETIIQGINSITGGSEEFNNIIFDIAKENIADLQQDEIGVWLKNLVLSNSSNFERFEESVEKDQRFCTDRKQLSNKNEDDSFDLISLFKKIYQNEPIRFDEKNSQHRKLKDMCFIILDKEHNLRILNEIYEKILDQNWIKGVMAELRPYTKAFRDWQHSDRQESSYLLQNNNLKLALEWLGKKPTPTLEEGETEFVMTSLVAEVWTTASPSVQSEAVSLITTFRPSLKGKNNYSDFLLQEILQWTRPEPLLLRELLEVVNKTEIFTTNYHNWIEQLVKTQIINNSQDSKLAEHFRLIEQRLTNHQSSESFWLIVKYRQILLQGKIEFDEIREDTKLIELGLVVKLDHQLEIANPIYENIFDKRWTYQKLSECKRIRAINLLKWCPANIPEQNDPVLRSYLDEWINNNATIIEKIVQEAKGEVLDNKFDFIDEIKLLTYDIMGMRTSDTPQISIQHSLNRIFKDDVKKMAQNNDLDSLLNKIVENATEIEAIVILGLKAGMVSGKNSNLESNNSSLYQIVRSETLVSFAKLKTIPDILDNFGEKTNFGKLSYAMFTLEKGVVISHFTKIQGNPFAICFISNSEVDMPGLFLAQCEGKFEKIQKELEKVLG